MQSQRYRDYYYGSVTVKGLSIELMSKHLWFHTKLRKIFYVIIRKSITRCESSTSRAPFAERCYAVALPVFLGLVGACPGAKHLTVMRGRSNVWIPGEDAPRAE